MEFKQLEAFVAAVDYNSFSDAAKHLYLTQPTISAHVSSLEKELNARLITRTTKKMELTAQGEQFYECAVSILNMRNKILLEFTGDGQKLISIGASTIPSGYILPLVLKEYNLSHTDIHFNIWQSDSKKVIAKVKEGSLDFGLVGTSIEDEDCVFLPFAKDDLTLITPNNDHYKKLKSKRSDLSSFVKEPFIMRENGSGTQKELENFLLSQQIDPSSLNCVARMNDPELLRQSVSGGIGIAIVSSRSAAEAIMQERVLEIPLKGEKKTRNLYIIYNKNKILKPHVKQMIHFIRQMFGDTSVQAL